MQSLIMCMIPNVLNSHHSLTQFKDFFINKDIDHFTSSDTCCFTERLIEEDLPKFSDGTDKLTIFELTGPQKALMNILDTNKQINRLVS